VYVLHLDMPQTHIAVVMNVENSILPTAKQNQKEGAPKQVGVCEHSRCVRSCVRAPTCAILQWEFGTQRGQSRLGNAQVSSLTISAESDLVSL